MVDMVTSLENGVVRPTMQIPQAGLALREAVEGAGIFPRNGPDPSARSWGHNSSGKTFGAQHKLPKQPLPSLETSCERYLDALKPLQSKEEHEASVAAVKTFLRGEGPLLQAQLKEYDESHLNYFENYCYEAFLSDDSPVVLNSNAFASFPPDPDPSRNGQVTRAAALVRSTLEFSQSIREDRLPLEEMRGVPQCMNQYWWLFGVTRVPCDDGGRLRMDADARHIIVMCRGQIYRLHVLEEDTFRIIEEKAVAAALQEIVNDAHKISTDQASASSIGVLTTENQKTWARCRTSLVQGSVQNGRNFAAIDRSLFALCLDGSNPETDQDVCRNMLCGTTPNEKHGTLGSCSNRWYDKLSVIVCQNGAAGMNFEHTCTDGSVDIRLACDIYEGSISAPKESSQFVLSSEQNGGLAIPKKLEWDIPTDIKEALIDAQTHLADRINQHQLAALNFRDYGKAFITSAGFSPDAFFQMAIHAAHFSMSGKVGNGFEPVLMRQYLHGRTDVARTTTSECATFAQIFNDSNATPKAKTDALRLAAAAHVKNFKECAQGLSHHRHLFVLNQIWKRRRAFLRASGAEDLIDDTSPIIFTDPGWSRLGTTQVMGSNVDNGYIAYAGFGPPSADGYTVCYYIRKDHIAMSVNSKNGKAQAYADAIEKTFNEIKILLEES